MKRACIFFSLIAILTLDGMAAWAQKVNVDWDQTANFQGYGTYAWAKGTPAKNPLMDERIVAAVDKQLAAKGLRKVDSGTSRGSTETIISALDAIIWAFAYSLCAS